MLAVTQSTLHGLAVKPTTGSLQRSNAGIGSGSRRHPVQCAAATSLTLDKSRQMLASGMFNFKRTCLLAAIVNVARDAGWLSIAKEFEFPTVLALPVTTVTTMYKDIRDAYVAADLYYSMLPALVPVHLCMGTVGTLLALAVQWIWYV